MYKAVRSLNFDPKIFIVGLLVICGCKNDLPVKTICCEYVNESDLNYNKTSGLFIFRDYEKGLKCAQLTDKPILLIFSSYMLPYDEFEYDLVKDARTKYILSQKFVVIKLFVDSKNKFDESSLDFYKELQLSAKSLKRIAERQTLGSINSSVQTDLFQSNVQPTYVLMTPNQKLLSEPFEYLSRRRVLFFEKTYNAYQLHLKNKQDE